MTANQTCRKPAGTERCETCRYLREGRDRWYECHRREPQISIRRECDDEAISPITLWPRTSLTDWCGEFAQKKQGRR